MTGFRLPMRDGNFSQFLVAEVDDEVLDYL